MFCFGLQSIERLILSCPTSYFNTHRLESEGIFLKLLNLSWKQMKMLFTGLGRSVLEETVPSV